MNKKDKWIRIVQVEYLLLGLCWPLIGIFFSNIYISILGLSYALFYIGFAIENKKEAKK